MIRKHTIIESLIFSKLMHSPCYLIVVSGYPLDKWYPEDCKCQFLIYTTFKCFESFTLSNM